MVLKDGLFGLRKIRALFLLKEAGLTALVAFVLALPLIGFKTITGGGRLEFVFRWEVLLATVSIIFFGRLTLAAVRDTWGKKGSVSTRFIRLSENIKKRRLFLTILIIAVFLYFHSGG